MRVLHAGLDDTSVDFLQQQNFVVAQAKDISDAEDFGRWLRDGEFDAGIIDLTHSGFGIYLPRSIRVQKIAAPLVGIVHESPGDISWGEYRASFLENGGDDLLRGPPNPRELAASLRASMRRFHGGLHDFVTLNNKNATLKVNLSMGLISINQELVQFTRREVDLLILLASRQGRVVSKEMIMEHMYTQGIDEEPELKIVDVFVCKIRNKLKAYHPDADFIHTAWGRGYMCSNSALLLEAV